MESNRRKQMQDMRTKIEVLETFIESLNTDVCSQGKILYGVSDEELQGMNWSDKIDAQLRDEEGLIMHARPYENPEDSWDEEHNHRYDLYLEAFKLVRTTLEKWVDK